MSDYITNDTELQSVADAIRTKGGTSAPLVYPTGFVNAISAIEVGIDTSDANATANDMLNGKTAYVDGQKITGNIPNQGAQTITPGTTNQTIAAGKYLTGAQTIVGDSNLVAANIAEGVSIFGVTGTHSSADPTDFIENRDTWTNYENLSASKIGAGVFAYCNNKLSNINFPVCTNIGSYAFYHCDLLPSVSFSVCTNIGDYAFGYCSDLTTVNFPACTSIGDSVFYTCCLLIDINFPVCKTIGSYAFCNCINLTTASFPACTSISDYAFGYDGGLTTANFPVCTNIGNNAFALCQKLSNINFPICTNISDDAFKNCKSLPSVNFPVCTNIGAYAFNNCSKLIVASFPACTSIGNNAFYNCSKLTSVNFPVCTNIDIWAFSACFSLSTASFPSCTSIGSSAFCRCFNLTSLYLTGSSYVSLANSNAFSSTPIGGYSASAGQYGSIYVPASMFASYKTRTNWTYFSSRFVSILHSGGGENN